MIEETKETILLALKRRDPEIRPTGIPERRKNGIRVDFDEEGEPFYVCSLEDSVWLQEVSKRNIIKKDILNLLCDDESIAVFEMIFESCLSWQERYFRLDVFRLRDKLSSDGYPIPPSLKTETLASSRSTPI